MNERDDKWLDVLAGKRPADDAVADEQEAASLRRVIEAEAAHQAGESPGDLEGLLTRLEDEQLLAPQQPARRPRWLALAAAVAFVALALPLAYLTFEQGPGVVVDPYTRGDAQPQSIAADDPAATAQAFAEALRQNGMTVEAYEYDGAWIVDGEIVPAQARAIERVLEQYGVDRPQSGRVLVEFSVEGASP